MVVFRHRYPPNDSGIGDPNPDPTLQTIYWRDAPLYRDEQALVGVHFTHPTNCPEHVASWADTGYPPSAGRRQTEPVLRVDPEPLVAMNTASWVYANTGLHDGDSVPGVYGQEADAFEASRYQLNCGVSAADPMPQQPAHRAGTFQILSASPFDAYVGGVSDPDLAPTHVPVNSVVYQACSGAWVFGAGSIMFGNALAPSLLFGKDYSTPEIRQMTRNLLQDP
jgi:hypothetical protein